jgi:hypothetical protein
VVDVDQDGRPESEDLVRLRAAAAAVAALDGPAHHEAAHHEAAHHDDALVTVLADVDRG